jgi:hypothetical protein
MNKNRIWRVAAALGVGLMALAGAAGARAEAEAIPAYTIYLSAPGTGKVGGVAYSDEDVMRFDTATQTWTKQFDGSDAGLQGAADIDAYAFENPANSFIGKNYMSFDRPVTVPGLGKVDDSDVVLYTTNLLGSSWTMILDGSEIGLTTDGEDIDGIALHYSGNGSLLLSTSGNYDLVGTSNTPYAGNDEDVLVWNKAQNAISHFLSGNGFFGIPAAAELHNLDSIWVNGGEEYVFLGMQNAATVGGVAAANSDVVAWRYFNNGHTWELLWDASANGFPKIDAVDVNFN